MKEQKDLKARIIVITSALAVVIVLLGAICFVKCGKVASTKNAGVYSIEDKKGILYCVADITHDGEAERIIINYGETVNYDQIPIPIEVLDSNGDTIWGEEIGIPHAGWGEYYITVVDGKPCLIFNCPEESQGQIAYYYKIFYLSNDGIEIIIEENNIFGDEQDVSQKKRSAFMKKVQAYIDKGDLFASTMYGELKLWK